jgi:hypothetical protein
LGSLLHIPIHPEMTTLMSLRLDFLISSYRDSNTWSPPEAMPQVPR